MQAHLNKHKHVLKNSKDLVKQLNDMTCEPGMKFLKGDIKHFFMSGEIDDLVALCCAPFRDDGIFPLLRRSIWFLLNNQFVLDPSTGVVLKVVKGSGMGLQHSSAVAECAFMHASELTLTKQLSVYHVSFYARFKDDIIIIYKDFDLLLEFFNLLKRGHPFKLECESVSSTSVQ